jgi:hypothetical protein
MKGEQEVHVMLWIVIGTGVVVLALLITVAVVRQWRGAPEQGTIEEVDPLFASGIAFTGAGVALATTLGPFMYGMMILGLVMMAVGANRTRHHHH